MSQSLTGAVAGLCTAIAGSLGVPLGIWLSLRLYAYRAPLDPEERRKWKRKVYRVNVVVVGLFAGMFGLALGITIALD
ncbi:MAG: hypothetical protein ACREN7_04095 [Candidatus Dormibacteria bacterium]